jgi:hypothetical protein
MYHGRSGNWLAVATAVPPRGLGHHCRGLAAHEPNPGFMRWVLSLNQTKLYPGRAGGSLRHEFGPNYRYNRELQRPCRMPFVESASLCAKNSRPHLCRALRQAGGLGDRWGVAVCPR